VPAEPQLFVYAALMGLVVGSFLNVVIHRLPRGSSLVRPPSRCPYCGTRVRARDNVPVLSYLLLRGRCRVCTAPISLRYPLIELLTAVLFVACVARFGPSAEAAVAALFCALLVVLAGIDAEHYLIPDRLTLPGIAVGLAIQPLRSDGSFLDALLGALIGAGLLILVINFWYWLRKEEGMGLGDVNMLAMVGAFLGWRGMVVTLFMAAFLGGASGLTLLVLRRLKLKSRLPFGVFLAAGALIALFWGDDLLDWYLHFL
jgi:leader peptidase (prepilin peptidase)/N-methyltransferase